MRLAFQLAAVSIVSASVSVWLWLMFVRWMIGT